MKDSDALTVANELRPVLLRLARRVRQESHELGVTGGQATLLKAIGDRPGITGRELAERESISAPAVSGALDRLESLGLIVRTRGTDRRQVGTTLSSEGERILDSIRRKRTAWLAKQLELLSNEERRAVEAAIEPLARLLAWEPEPGP